MYKFKKFIYVLPLILLISCGGGGGGAVNSVTNFVENQVSELAGSDNIINSYAANIANLNNVLSGGDLGSLANIFTSPTDTDREKASELLGIINNVQVLWQQVTSLINSQDNSTKYQIYNSNDYKNARAAYLFLTNTVKPIVGKVATGQSITTTEFNKVADESTAFDIVETEKTTTVESEVSTLKSEVNTVKTSEILDPKVITSTSESAEYTETTYVDSEESNLSINGTPVVTESTEDISSQTDNGDGTITTVVTRYTTTITTTPVTIKTIKVRTFTDSIFKDITVTTTSIPQTKNTMIDGTVVIEEGTATSTTTTVKTLQRTQTREETIIMNEEITNSSTEVTNGGVVVSTTTTSTAYTNADPNLGTKSPGYSNLKSTYETNEYFDRDDNGNLQGWANGGKKQVKASDAYSKGWTGKGVTVAVADTGYDTDHSEFSGQVVATKDYTGTGMNDEHGHGTHVLGSMIAKKDGTGTHGVAFDSKAVVIKITNSNYANTSLAADGFSWAADQGASVGNISANSNYDVYFRNNLEQLSDGTYKSTDERYDYSTGTFYNMQTPDEWIAATSKDLIVVNSAGNQGLDVPANPGYFSTAVDGNGELVLGGKMLIVGAVDQNNNMASWSNKAGHICQVIVDNSCTDKFKVSDFYLLAPGWTYSTKNDGSYGTMAGTSMAAPYVTGGVALLRQMWPYMKGENVVRLLTTTANKNISGYNENIHGSGIMDLDEATKPQGALGIPTTGRSTSSASTVSLGNSGGSGSALSSFIKLSELQNIMILDDYDRDYYINLASGLTVKDTRKISDVNASLVNKNYLSFQNQFGSFTQGGQMPLPYGFEFGFMGGENGNGDWTTNIAKYFNVNEKFKIKLSAGLMEEQNTWLGNYTDGALAVGKNNQTRFSQIDLSYLLNDWELFFKGSRGYTDVNINSNSLIKNFDTLETTSLKLGLEKKLDDNKKWGVSYSIPNYISKGQSQLSVPYATTMNGDILYDDIQVDMKSKSKEKNLAIYYSNQTQIETEWKTSFSLEYRQNISGVSGDNDIVPTFSVSKKFWGACSKFLGMQNNKPFCKKIRAEKKLKQLEKNKEKNKIEINLLKNKIAQYQNQIQLSFN